jgi:uncharacterized delta-60 repeat protein
MGTRLAARFVALASIGVAAEAGCAAVLGFEETTLRSSSDEGGTGEGGAGEDGGEERDAAPSRLTTTPATVLVRRGGSADITVDVVRGSDETGTVIARLADLPAGVTATMVTLPPPSTSGMLKISAAATSSLGTKTIKLFADGTSLPPADIPLVVSDLPGSLDVTFDADGFLSDSTRGLGATFHVVRVLADQRIIAGGGAGVGGQPLSGWIARRYGASGAPDGAFNALSAAAPMPADGEIRAMAVDAFGRIVCLGASQSGPQQQLTMVRLGVTGAIDTTFGAPTGVVRLPNEGSPGSSTFGFGLTIQPDGMIVVVGSRKDLLVANESGIITRFKADGTRDPTFNGGATVVLPNRRFIGVGLEGTAVLAAGSTTAGAQPSYVLTRRTSLGAVDATFGINGGDAIFGTSYRAHGFVRLADGSLGLVGDVQQGAAGYTAGVANVKGTGVFARVFANATSAGFFGVAAQDATRIVAVGHTAVANGEARVERFFVADGKKDPSFNDGGTSTIEPGGIANGFEVTLFSAAVQTDGRILAAGNRSNAGAVIYRLWP